MGVGVGGGRAGGGREVRKEVGGRRVELAKIRWAATGARAAARVDVAPAATALPALGVPRRPARDDSWSRAGSHRPPGPRRAAAAAGTRRQLVCFPELIDEATANRDDLKQGHLRCAGASAITIEISCCSSPTLSAVPVASVGVQWW